MTSYERVKLSRRRTATTFPLPTPLDCIRYALCELAEYDDAMLRTERIGDKRNSAKAHDPRAELGQAIYMLLSAAVQWRIPPRLYDLPQQPRLHLYSSALNWLTGFTLSPVRERLGTVLSEKECTAVSITLAGAYTALCALAAAHGWEVEPLIGETCATFEAKHVEVKP
jgi:hypothetical protein